MTYFRENIEKAAGYVPGFQPAQADVVKLNTNENPYPASEKVTEAISNISAEQLRRYPQPAGSTFRSAAAEVLGVGADNIMCTNGGDDLLTICLRAFCDKSRPVAYPVPTYSLYSVLAQLQNCTCVEVPFDKECNLPAKLTSTDAALTIVCNPNAPTATCIKCDELASLADEIKGVLLIDEAYVDFADENCLELVKDFDNVIILRSMSKGYSLAGIRFGYCIAQAEMINGLMKVKDSYNVDTPAITAATAAILDQEYFKENVRKVIAERQRLTDALSKLGFPVPKSQTNFVLAGCSNAKAAVRIDKALQERDIYVRYFSQGNLKDKLRITVGTADQNDKLIEALKEILANKES